MKKKIALVMVLVVAGIFSSCTTSVPITSVSEFTVGSKTGKGKTLSDAAKNGKITTVHTVETYITTLFYLFPFDSGIMVTGE